MFKHYSGTDIFTSYSFCWFCFLHMLSACCFYILHIKLLILIFLHMLRLIYRYYNLTYSCSPLAHYLHYCDKYDVVIWLLIKINDSVVNQVLYTLLCRVIYFSLMANRGNILANRGLAIVLKCNICKLDIRVNLFQWYQSYDKIVWCLKLLDLKEPLCSYFELRNNKSQVV